MDLREVITGSRPTQAQASQNLINPSKVTVSSDALERTTFYKSLALEACAVLAATLFGFAYYRYLAWGLSVWLLLAALVLFSAAFALQSFLIKKGGGRMFLMLVLQTLGLIGFFWEDDWRILAITGIVVLVFLGWGYVAGSRKLANSVSIPFFGVSEAALSKFTTGVLIFMILIYTPKLGGNPLVVSSQSFRTFFDWASGLVNNFYPDLSLNGSFGNFSQSFTKMELQNNPNFQNLTPAEQNAALAMETQQFEASFLKNAPKDAVAPSSSTSDAFYNVLQGMMNAWRSESGGWFLVGWIAVIFIALRSVGVVFVWLAEFVTLIFYELLLALGFMKISEEEHVREVIGY